MSTSQRDIADRMNFEFNDELIGFSYKGQPLQEHDITQKMLIDIISMTKPKSNEATNGRHCMQAIGYISQCLQRRIDPHDERSLLRYFRQLHEERHKLTKSGRETEKFDNEPVDFSKIGTVMQSNATSLSPSMNAMSVSKKPPMSKQIEDLRCLLDVERHTLASVKEQLQSERAISATLREELDSLKAVSASSRLELHSLKESETRLRVSLQSFYSTHCNTLQSALDSSSQRNTQLESEIKQIEHNNLLYQELKMKYDTAKKERARMLQAAAERKRRRNIRATKTAVLSKINKRNIRKRNLEEKQMTSLACELELKNKKLSASLKDTAFALHTAQNALLWQQESVHLPKVPVNSKTGRSYSPEMYKLIMALKTVNISDSNVGKTIKMVADYLGVDVSVLPSARTVERAMIMAGDVCKAHDRDIIGKNMNLCLGSDETTKLGRKLQSYYLSYSKVVDGKVVTLGHALGAYEVAEKSSRTQIDVLNRCLDRLGETYGNETFVPVAQLFYERLASTISDSAATQKKLNKLLQEVKTQRVSCKEGFADLSVEEQDMAVAIQNMYCQMHALSNMMNPLFTSILQFENQHYDCNSNKRQRLESGLCLAQTIASEAARLFGERLGSVGYHRDFTTFVKKEHKSKAVRVSPNIPSLLGHRYAIYTVIADRTMYWMPEIEEFVSLYKNPELAQFLEFAKSDLASAELFLVVSLSQKIVKPLWNAVEMAKHVLETRDYVKTIMEYIEDMKADLSKFYDKTSANVIAGDWPILNYLPDAWQNMNAKSKELLLSMAPQVLKEISAFLTNYYAPFLVGQYSDATINSAVGNQLLSTPTTNNAVEATFALIDRSFSFAPNMKTVRRSIHMKMVKNKSIDWLDGLEPEAERAIIIEALHSRARAEKEAANDEAVLAENILANRAQKAAEQEKSYAKDFDKKSTLTEEVMTYGYWTIPADIDDFVEGPIYSDTEVIRALRTQIRFRKEVLGQRSNIKGIFSIANLGEKELRVNLVTLMAASMYSGMQPVDSSLVGKQFKQKFLEGDEDVWYNGIIERVIKKTKTGKVKSSLEYLLMRYAPLHDLDFRARPLFPYTTAEFEQALHDGDIVYLKNA